MPKDGARLAQPGDIEQAEYDGEIVLWTGRGLHRLDRVGSVIWRLLESEPTAEELVAMTAARFGERPGAVREAVASLCAELSARGLLVDASDAEVPTPERGAAAAGPFVGPGEIPQPLSDRPLIEHRSGSFRALNHSFAVHSSSAVVGDYLSRAFGGLAVPGPAEHIYVVVELDDGRWAITMDDLGLTTSVSAETAIRHVIWHVNSETIRQSSDDFVLVHGGGVSSGPGTAIFPGRMNAGKTTLVAGLLLAGYEYVTDELLALDSRGRVHPYPRPMNIGHGSWNALPALAPDSVGPVAQQWFVNPLSVPGAVLATPSQPSVIIEPRYREGSVDELLPLSKFEALELLRSQVMNVDPLRAESFRVLVATVRAASCFRLQIGTLTGAVERVRSVVGGGV